MAKVINLRTRRKQTARDTARRDAGANAARFGQTKADKSVQTARAEKAARDLDGHKRDEPS